MIIFKYAAALSEFLHKAKISNSSVGFVPTMGALHSGHKSLVDISKSWSNITVVSIFVNPLQFNDPNDFLKYPVNYEKDIHILTSLDVDVLFLPSEEQVYPPENPKHPIYELGSLDTILEGAFRPGHFQGVSTVMDRLLTIVHPNFLFLGQKDFQQVMVIKKLLSLIDIKVKTIIVPTIREADGLAMSSRNVRLTEEFRMKSPMIFDQLQIIKNSQFQESFKELRKAAIEKLQMAGFQVEYLELADTSHLAILDHFSPGKSMVLLIAVYAGNIRLIDNMLL